MGSSENFDKQALMTQVRTVLDVSDCNAQRTSLVWIANRKVISLFAHLNFFLNNHCYQSSHQL